MTKLVIAFRYGDRRWFSRLISWWQKHDAAHCEAAVPLGSEFICISASKVDGGVRTKTMPLPADKWRLYEVDTPTAAAVDWYYAQRGAKYDWLGLFGFVWRPLSGRRRAWFCSEAVADILKLPDPWRYDVALLESVVAKLGRPVSER